MAEHQWGVVFEGRDLGWISYDDRGQAEWEVRTCDDKYQPCYLARRELGPIERIDS